MQCVQFLQMFSEKKSFFSIKVSDSLIAVGVIGDRDPLYLGHIK